MPQIPAHQRDAGFQEVEHGVPGLQLPDAVGAAGSEQQRGAGAFLLGIAPAEEFGSAPFVDHHLGDRCSARIAVRPPGQESPNRGREEFGSGGTFPHLPQEVALRPERAGRRAEQQRRADRGLGDAAGDADDIAGGGDPSDRQPARQGRRQRADHDAGEAQPARTPALDPLEAHPQLVAALPLAVDGGQRARHVQHRQHDPVRHRLAQAEDAKLGGHAAAAFRFQLSQPQERRGGADDVGHLDRRAGEALRRQTLGSGAERLGREAPAIERRRRPSPARARRAEAIGFGGLRRPAALLPDRRAAATDEEGRGKQHGPHQAGQRANESRPRASVGWPAERLDHNRGRNQAASAGSPKASG